jgi:2-polyprenyl-6-methoxyphenol hydroxylase-like FAD-dependent oxidoreductase
MKVVIIGGGIAGSAIGLFLKRMGHEVVVNEKQTDNGNDGFAFLMHKEGRAIIEDLFSSSGVQVPGWPVLQFRLVRPDNKQVIDLPITDWVSMRRTELVQRFHEALGIGDIKKGRDFSHFLYNGNQITAAVFENGEVEDGDIFIGADGSKSKIRPLVTDDIYFTPTEVKEIVGIVRNEKIARITGNTFAKIQHGSKGLAMGYIPVSEEEMVWYIQYDPALCDLEQPSPEDLHDFCKELVKDFPQEARDIIAANDFSNTYIWFTRDMEMLPTFSKDNLVLIGDAAHIALPFTSAGTTNAILDAQALYESLCSNSNYQQAFEAYYKLRAENVKKHLELGRALKKVFLQPETIPDNKIPVPLINTH